MRVKVQLKPPQEKALQFLLPRKAGIASYMTGSGKSVIAILACFYLLSRDKVDKAILVATKSSAIEIENEFETRTDISPYLIKSYHDFEDFFNSASKVGILNYNFSESVPIGRVIPIIRSTRIVVCFDEVHSLKTPTSERTKYYQQWRPYIDHCYGFTATVIGKNIFDLYHVIDFISPGYFGTAAHYRFEFVETRKKEIKTRGGRSKVVEEIVKLKNLDILNKRLNKIMVSHHPPMDINFDRRHTTLHSNQDYMVAARGFFVDDLNTSGTIVFSDSRVPGNPKQHSSRLIDLQYVVNRDKAKRQLLEEVLIENFDCGVLVFCAYYDTVDVVKSVIGRTPLKWRIISGEQSSEERKKAKEWFIGSPRGKVMIITAAGGQSFNLQATNKLICYDTPFGVGPFIQLMGRVVREYSDFKQFDIIFICARDTIDDYKFALLESNKELLRTVLETCNFPGNVDRQFNIDVIKMLRKHLLWKPEDR